MRRPVSSTFRLVLLICALSLGAASAGYAQAPLGEEEGTATIEGWPRSLPTLLDEMGQKAPYLLPRIDSLALDYRYAVTDTTSRWSFVLSWRPAERVLYEGKVLPRREAPQGIRMTNAEFRANVRVDGEKRAEMIIGIDSMALRPTPNRFAFNVAVPHERVFLDTSPAEARRILSEGATLERLVVERMGFSAGEDQRRGDRSPDARQRQEEPSRTPSIYRPRTRILIGWRVAPQPYYVDDGDGDGDRRTRRPRGETIGRTPTADADRPRDTDRDDETEGRRGDGEDADEGKTDGDGTDRSRGEAGREDDDDDEDEDDADLGTPALAAAAAVGIIAASGGTAGLYGRGGTPIGLTSGYAHPKGGVQLQAAVNQAVIEDKSNQKLSVKALGFYDVFESRLQPAVGVGAHIDPGAGRDWEPVVSVGLVGNLGRFVLHGGVDVVQGTPEISVAYNFRYEGDENGED